MLCPTVGLSVAAQSHRTNAQTVSFVTLRCTHLHSFGQHAWAVASNDSRISDISNEAMTEQPLISLRHCTQSTRLGSQKWHCQITDTDPAFDMPE